MGVLRSRDLSEPKVSLVGGLCLAQGGPGRAAAGAVSCRLSVPLLLLLTEETSAFPRAQDVFSTQYVFENVRVDGVPDTTNESWQQSQGTHRESGVGVGWGCLAPHPPCLLAKLDFSSPFGGGGGGRFVCRGAEPHCRGPWLFVLTFGISLETSGLLGMKALTSR